MEKKLYIAYGSNLNRAQMAWRCPSARFVKTDAIPDYRLLFRGSKTGSYLAVEPMQGRSVPVAIWEVTPEDEAALDRYEGYPAFYDKVEEESGRGFLYVMQPGRSLGKPSLRYVETCLAGYRDMGFDEDILWEAIRETIRESRR